MALEFDGTLITLVDEDGVEKEFEHIYTIENGGETYIGLIPVAESAEELLDSDGELVILKVMVDEKGEEYLATIDNEEEFDRVAAEFEVVLEEDYDIETETESPAGEEDGEDSGE